MSGPDLCEHGNDGSQPCAECAATDSHAPAAPAPLDHITKLRVRVGDLLNSWCKSCHALSAVGDACDAHRWIFDSLNAIEDAGSAHRGLIRALRAAYRVDAVGGIEPAPEAPLPITAEQVSKANALLEHYAPTGPETTDVQVALGLLQTWIQSNRQYPRPA